MAGPLHRRVHQAALFDSLRESVGRNGAWKSPAFQSELPAIGVSMYAQMDSSGIGQAGTMGRASRTYTGGGLHPQNYTIPVAGVNTDTQLRDAGVAMNARAAYPGRGLTPNPSSPMARRA